MPRTTFSFLLLLLTSAVVSAQDEKPLEFSRWSGDLNVPDPVAISFDNHGTAYVTQTQRRKAQDLDIRNNRDWIPNDVGFQSVEQKRAFYRSRLAPGTDQARNRDRVRDHNNDGSHDWKDLTAISEKLHWLRDDNGDGIADAMGLYAEDFQTEVTGIAAGVLWHEGNVYATIAPDVWRLRDTDQDRQADQREVVATGFGLHIAYGGHDMHGLTVGPDGKIYWSIGDKGISVTTADGKRLHYPNQGGVLRCDPDGSNFEVFAHGLRNVQELAFDAAGNLFGVDNDSDQENEKERFVYIVRDMDAGWRCNYQYRGSGYNPWTEEKLWLPHFDGQASYILPAIQNYVDGPAGFAFNPGTALNSKYRDHFFLTGAPGGFQFAFKVRSDGASFEMEDEHLIGSGIPLVGINFGPDGALYAVDWGGGYPLNQTGAVWKIDAPNSDLSEQRREVAIQLKNGFDGLALAKLTKLLGHADQRVRLGAQFELVKQNAADSLIESLQAESEYKRFHAVWGLGQLARHGDSQAKAALLQGLTLKDAEMLAQLTRTLTDVKDVDGQQFVRLLDHSDERVQFMASLALSKHPTKKAIGRLLSLSNELLESKRYLRFAVSRALAACATGTELAAAHSESSLVGRLNLVVAIRQQQDHSHLNGFLSDEHEQVATEAARALHDDFSSSSQLTALADSLNKAKLTGEGFLLRAMNANYRLGGKAESNRLAMFAADSARDDQLRIEALSMLATWKTPDTLDRVDGRHRELSSGREFDREVLAAELSRLAIEDDPRMQAAAVRAARQLGINLAAESLQTLLASRSVASQLRVESLRSLDQQDVSSIRQLLDRALVDRSSELRMAAAEILSQRDSDSAEQHLIKTIQDSKQLPERQHAIALLGTIAGERSIEALGSMLQKLAAGKLAREIALDVLDAASAIESLRQQVNSANQAILQINDKKSSGLREFVVCVDGGDSATGKALFQSHLGAQCVRCHKVGKKGSDVGPNLKGIAKKKDRGYLLRSIIAPSAEIDPKYQTQSFLMFDGQVLQGLVKEERDEETVIIDNSGKEIRLDNDEIEFVKKNEVSIMPEMTKVLTRREIRDLVAYLASLKD
ncbi:MAG: PVC-type heme-binding CxxCH protein [Rubripirellula sp.]